MCNNRGPLYVTVSPTSLTVTPEWTSIYTLLPFTEQPVVLNTESNRKLSENYQKKQNLQTTKQKRWRWNCYIWKSGNYHEMYNFWGWVRITIYPHFQKRLGLWLGFFHTSNFYPLLLKNLPQFIWAVLNFHNTPIAISAARTLKISLYNNFLVILPYFSFYYHLLSVFRTLLRVFGSIWFIFGIFGCFRYLATPQWPHTAVCGTPSTNRHLSAI